MTNSEPVFYTSLIKSNHKIFLKAKIMYDMLYHFELQMAGAILLTAMLVGGIYLWVKRRRERLDEQNDISDDDSHLI